jgi:epoxyqueuosine reductase QueG
LVVRLRYCQEVCPWNQARNAWVAGGVDCDPASDANPIDLIALFDLDDDDFATFRHTPLAPAAGNSAHAAIILAINVPPATAALTKRR